METKRKGAKKGELIQLDMVRIERNRDKKCSCENPVYLIDTTNEIVECERCGAEVKPFKALKEIGSRYERTNEKYAAMEKRGAELMEHWDALVRIEKFVQPFRKFIKYLKGGNSNVND